MTTPTTPSGADRTASVTRNTAETKITVSVNLDGTGKAKLATGIGFFDHMLDQIARHGLIDLDIDCQGDLHIDGHHTVEDVGITFGQAVAKAIGDKKGIRRYGHAYVPLDEALSRVVIDFSGRPGPRHARALHQRHDRQLRQPAHLRVLPGLRANHAFVTLHIDNLKGVNAHHQCETVFKAFARAMRARSSSIRAPSASFPRPRVRSEFLQSNSYEICSKYRRRRRLRHGQPALRVAGRAHRRRPGGVEVFVTSDPEVVRQGDPRGAAGAGRHARLHARAARFRPSGVGARSRRQQAALRRLRRHADAAVAQRRRADRRPRPDPRRGASSSTSRAGCSPTAAASRCPRWAGTRCARPTRMRSGRVFPT
jgi:imidazoleglycerol-phosphate dehydratase